MPLMPLYFKFTQAETPVCRLGLATRGNSHLRRDDVLLGLEHGINYLNWCGYEDGMSQAARELGSRRKDVIIATQLSARSGEEAKRELGDALDALKTSYLDVITFYYVESPQEWQELIRVGGAFTAMKKAQQGGLLRMLGLTTHQRRLAGDILHTLLLDLLMVRYNAAHRGAEREIFSEAQRLKMPLVTFTALRWKALLDRTREDPANFIPPPAREWYRFVLAHPAVSVALMAPKNRHELMDNLQLLDDWRLPTASEYEALRLHGDRVHRNAGGFP
jgi:predicted aldo/keto reductase-like oxidoreductase